MPWLIPLCLCLALLAIVTAIFFAERFDDVQARLEKQANALADELLARTKDTKE